MGVCIDAQMAQQTREVEGGAIINDRCRIRCKLSWQYMYVATK